MDLLTLSHAELVTLVQQQHALITELQATVAAQAATIQRLEQRLRELDGGAAPPRGMFRTSRAAFGTMHYRRITHRPILLGHGA